MPKKRPSLDSQLSKQDSKQLDAPTIQQADVYTPQQADAPASTRAKARNGKKAISGFYDPAVSKQLRVLGIEEDKTVQALLGEALNLLFEKYGKDAIASEE